MHDKQIFEALKHPLTKAFLSDEENAFIEEQIPATYFLTDEDCDLAAVRTNKDDWIIKPTDNYGAADVYAGKACSEEEWNALIDRFADTGQLVRPSSCSATLRPIARRRSLPATDLEWLVEQGLATSVEEVEREGVLLQQHQRTLPLQWHLHRGILAPRAAS